MASVSKVIILGNLGKDPFYAETDKNGKELAQPYAKFTVLVNPYLGKDKESIPVSYQVTVNGFNAKYIRDFAKSGMQIHVIGEIKRNGPAMKDGKEVRTAKGDIITNLDVQADTVTLTGNRSDSQAKTSSATAGESTDDEELF